MDWHLVGDFYSLCVLKTKEPKAFVVSSPTNSFQSFCCQVKDVQSTSHEPAMSPGTECTRNLSGQHFGCLGNSFNLAARQTARL